MAEALALGLLLLLVLAGLDHLHDLVLDGAVLLRNAHALEGADGVVEALLGQVPARGLGHETDADPQGHGRDGAQDEHVAPGLAVTGADAELVEEGVVLGAGHRAALGGLELGDLVEDVGAGGEVPAGVVGDGDLRAALEGVDDGVHREGEQLAGDDHELVDGHDGAADAFGCGLRQVDGDGCGGGSDGEAQDDAEGVHDPHVGGDGGSDRADEEQDGQDGDVVAPAPAVRHESAEQCAQSGPDQQGASDGTFLEGGQLEPLGGEGHVHVRQGAGDDAGVVAEEQ